MVIDNTESYAYLACDNQNIYSYSLEVNTLDPKTK
jgi:hypothetical protein